VAFKTLGKSVLAYFGAVSLTKKNNVVPLTPGKPRVGSSPSPAAWQEWQCQQGWKILAKYFILFYALLKTISCGRLPLPLPRELHALKM
jgi:hypothetical protein